MSSVTPAQTAIARLEPLTHEGYTLEAAGDCIRINKPSNKGVGSRYVMVASILTEKAPTRYALSQFATRH